MFPCALYLGVNPRYNSHRDFSFCSTNRPVNMRIAILTLLHFGAALADTSSYVMLKPTNGNKVCNIFVQPS